MKARTCECPLPIITPPLRHAHRPIRRYPPERERERERESRTLSRRSFASPLAPRPLSVFPPFSSGNIKSGQAALGFVRLAQSRARARARECREAIPRIVSSRWPSPLAVPRGGRSIRSCVSGDESDRERDPRADGRHLATAGSYCAAAWRCDATSHPTFATRPCLRAVDRTGTYRGNHRSTVGDARVKSRPRTGMKSP